MIADVMRKTITGAVATLCVNTAATACPIRSDEKLVCEMVMCVPGLEIEESREECLDIMVEWAEYLAKLGPFDDPPNCYMRDGECRRKFVITPGMAKFFADTGGD